MRTYLKNMYYMTASVFKDFITLFWMLIFPLLLLSFFKLGFGNLLKDNQNLKIKVGISPDNYYSVIYKSIDIFDVSILNENEGIAEVENEKISGYVKSDGSLVFFNSNMKSRIIKQVSDQILQISNFSIGVPARLLREVRVWWWLGPRMWVLSVRVCSRRGMASSSLPASW